MAVLNRQTRRLNDETRFNRIRDLEHQCRLWENAYVMDLQGNRTMRLPQDKARAWKMLLDLMFGILKQEGVVIDFEEEEGENDEGVRKNHAVL